MKNQRRIVVSRLIGGIQCALGTLAFMLAYASLTSPSVKEIFSVTAEESFLVVFLLFVFGGFSLLSGLILVRDKL